MKTFEKLLRGDAIRYCGVVIAKAESVTADKISTMALEVARDDRDML